MDEAMVENLSNLANHVLTYGGALVMAEGLDPLFSMTLVALIFLLLAAQSVKRKRGVLKSSRGRGSVTNKRVSGRLFNRQRSPALKPCPNCAKQLPVTAIICGICDYNFLAERPGRGQKLLPSPQPPTDETPEQNILSTELIKPRETLGIVL